MNKNTRTLVALATLTLSVIATTASAQGTAFTYQGRLNDGAGPATGIYDLRFAIYDSTNLPGNLIAGPLTNSATAISNGLFTVTLDFSNVFPGAARWLDIGVRTNGGEAFTTLNTRQLLTPAPYAITAGNVVSGGLAAGTYGNAVTISNATDSFAGSFSGNGANVTNVNAVTLGGLTAAGFWKTAGNTGTSPGANFLGTADNQPLNLRVNNIRAFHLEPAANDASHSNIVNVIGGSPANLISSGVYGATIAGGGAVYYFGFGSTNSATADFATVSGGAGNSSSALDASVGGGYGNISSGGAATVGGGFLNISSNSSSTVAGGAYNVAGGQEAAVGGGYTNMATGAYSVIGGGYGNANFGELGFIGAGLYNILNSYYAFIGSGSGNKTQTNADYSVIAGGAINSVQPGAQYASIGGGDVNVIDTNASYSSIGGGNHNYVQATAQYASIGGGQQNVIQQAAQNSTIGGGSGNLVTTLSADSTVGGGTGNTSKGLSTTVSGGQNNLAFGLIATVGGGDGNAINAAAYTTISGGQSNVISVNADYATVGGGALNTNTGQYSTIGGGWYNQISAGAGYATIGGGWFNTVSGGASTVAGGDGNTASGVESMVPGGFANTAAGDYSFAAGFGAEANHESAFVWSDDTLGSVDFTSTGPDQFLIHAIGGVGIGTNAPSAQLHVASASGSPQFQITQQNTSDYSRLRMGVSGNPTWEIDVSPGATPQLQFWNGSEQMYITYTGDAYAHSFNNTSDRNIKENFSAVSPQEVLDKVAAMPITRWNFKDDKASEHLGPMAQDFHSAFGLGTDDKHIATVDEEGVALAAIQGLNQKLEQKDTEIAELKARLDKLEKFINSKIENAP